MIIFELCYDRCWGQRHPRPPELSWLFDKRLNAEMTMRFLRNEGCGNDKAYTWRRHRLEVKSEILRRYREQDKNAVKLRDMGIYGATSRSGPLLKD